MLKSILILFAIASFSIVVLDASGTITDIQVKEFEFYDIIRISQYVIDEDIALNEQYGLPIRDNLISESTGEVYKFENTIRKEQYEGFCDGYAWRS